MKATQAVIQFLNDELTEAQLLESVPAAHELLGGFKSVVLELAQGYGAKVTVCAICGRAILRRRVLAGRRYYCDAERCKKIQKLGHSKPVTLASAPVPTRSCYREIQAYHGGYCE